MKFKITSAQLCKFRNTPDAACRLLPRCLRCSRALPQVAVKCAAKLCDSCRADLEAGRKAVGR